MTELGIVVPVHDEEAVLDELVRRCAEAADQTGYSWSMLLVDDGSSDGTRSYVPDDERVDVYHLPFNRGQLRATLEGLGRIDAERIIVLDGDLQDPPEFIGALVAESDQRSVDVVFAAKRSRTDRLRVRAGARGYHLLQRAGRHRIPPGAGSYCILNRALARRAAALPIREGNLAALLVALGASCATVVYDKGARYDARSRVGTVGLAREAVASLALSGALHRVLAGAAAGMTATGLVLSLTPVGWALIGTGAVTAGVAARVRRRAREELDE